MGEEPVRGAALSVRLLALVEGQTEEQFCTRLIAPFLGTRGVYLSATTMGRPRAVAGVQSWKRTERELRQLLLSDREHYVTTMFDYYGMPRDWPGREEANDKPPREKARAVENGMRARLDEAIGGHWRPERFVPYVQMHEFEALLFTEPRALGTVLEDSEGGPVSQELQRIANEFSTPEEIDDGKATAPSKRILKLASGYEKVAQGITAASRTSLPAIRAACPNFDAWIRKLEALPDVPATGSESA